MWQYEWRFVRDDSAHAIDDALRMIGVGGWEIIHVERVAREDDFGGYNYLLKRPDVQDCRGCS